MEEKFVQDIDGNQVPVNDQGVPMDASHSHEEEPATETESPRASEESVISTKAKPEEKPFDWEKSYKELEKTFTRDRQELARIRKENESFSPYKDKVSNWAKADELLTKSPEAMQYLQARLQGLSHNEAQSYAEAANQNPALEKLLEKVSHLESNFSSIQQEKLEAQASSTLDAEETKAANTYKEMFGKDISQEEKTEMYNWMVKHNLYDGQVAMHALYAKQFAEAYGQKLLAEQKTKGTKVISKTNTTNSAKAAAPEKAMSFREAFDLSMAELRNEA